MSMNSESLYSLMSRVFLGSSLGCCFGDIYVDEASGIMVDDDNTTTHDMQMKKDKYNY
jgi:hypothetical protein